MRRVTWVTAPELVTLHVWGVSRWRVPQALLFMASEPRTLGRGPAAPSFGKFLGTGSGRTFGVRDADPRHWALLATWSTAAEAEDFEHGPHVARWDRLSHERLRVVMRPLSSRGSWSGRQPFGDPPAMPYAGPVAAVTRARLAPRRLLSFWRAVPPVAADLHRRPGLRLALGIGEAPVGLQGTFSLWDSDAALRNFAAGAAHAAVVARTPEVGWYAEELFARLAVESVQGSYEGRMP